MSSTTLPPSLRDTSALLRIYGEHPFRTDGDVHALEFAPDGTLWSVEDTGVLRQWDLAAKQQLHWHHLEELATLWAFSPGARFLASGSEDVTVWEVATGEVVNSWPQADWVTALAFHPLNGLLATGHDDNIVRLWDLNKKRPLREFRAHASAISALAFSSDGTRLASAGEDKTIYLWEIDHEAPCGSLTGHTDRIPALAWHPDGKRLVSAGWDTTARVWNVQSCEPIILLNSHASQVHTLAFNHDGSRLACADSANAVHIWDMARNRTVNVLKPQANEIRCLAFSPDGQQLASAGVERVLHVWDARRQADSDSPSEPLPSRVTLAVRDSGRQLLDLAEGAALRSWDTLSGESVPALANVKGLQAFSVSPDNVWIAASLRPEDVAAEQPTLGLWDGATGKQARWLEGQQGPMTALAFAPDGRTLASASSQSGDVWLWQIANGEPLLLIPNATAPGKIEALAWHPHSRLLACAGVDWLSKSGRDGQVVLWDVSEKKVHARFEGGATALAFDPTGRKLAAAQLKHTVRVWELDSEEPALELIGHFDAVTCLAYSPDGRLLATGGDDHTIRLWDADSGLERGLLELDTQIKALAFSPDGRYLYTGNGNTSCYQLDVDQIPRD